MMADDDIHAFGPPPPAAPSAPATPAARRRRWPWVLGLAALVLLCTVATALWLGHEVLRALPAPGPGGWRVVVDGDEVVLLQGASPLAVGLALAGAALLVVLALALVLGLVVPLVLLVAAGAVVAGLLLAALAVAVVALGGLGLGAVALVLATAPLWLPVLLVVLLLRRGRRSPAPAA